MQVSAPTASNLSPDKLHYQVFWMLSHIVALDGHRCGRGRRIFKDTSRPRLLSRPSMDETPGVDFPKSRCEDRTVECVFETSGSAMWSASMKVGGDKFQTCLRYQERDTVTLNAVHQTLITSVFYILILAPKVFTDWPVSWLNSKTIRQADIKNVKVCHFLWFMWT